MYGNDRFESGSRGGFRQDGFVAPVRVGEEIEVRIEALGEKGDGIAKKKGFVIFVAEVAKDDMVKIKITKVLKKVAFAEVVEKLEKLSEEPAREAAPAPVVPEPEEDLVEIPEEDFENASEDFGEEAEDDSTETSEEEPVEAEPEDAEEAEDKEKQE